MTPPELLRLYHTVRVVVSLISAVFVTVAGLAFDWPHGLALAPPIALLAAHALLARRHPDQASFSVAIVAEVALAGAATIVIGLHVVTAVAFLYYVTTVAVLGGRLIWPLVYVVAWFVPSLVLTHLRPARQISEALEVTIEVAAVGILGAGLWVLVRSVMDRLHKAEVDRGIMLGKVSHELRNALTGALGMAEVLEEQLENLEAGEIAGMVEMIAGETAEANQILEDLLVAARAERGALEVELRDVDLRLLVEEVAHHRAPDASITGAHHLPARADPLRVRQILRNLLSNAARYGGERVEIRLGRRDGRALLAVADNGAGVPEGDEEAIFASFRRAQGARHPDSVGLGLSVSLQLARAMGGDLAYRREEGWTVFELSLAADSSERIREPAPA